MSSDVNKVTILYYFAVRTVDVTTEFLWDPYVWCLFRSVSFKTVLVKGIN